MQLIAEKLGLDLRVIEKKGLEGLWDGVTVTDRDIEEAKKAVSGKR